MTKNSKYALGYKLPRYKELIKKDKKTLINMLLEADNNYKELDCEFQNSIACNYQLLAKVNALENENEQLRAKVDWGKRG